MADQFTNEIKDIKQSMVDHYKVSIIIPHHNSFKLLEKLLSTIPDRKEIQIIVVDDHSTEKVKKQLCELQANLFERDILFLDNDTDEHNAGATRNIGLKHAGGEWLLFADADDYFLDGFYDVIEPWLDSNYDIVYFSHISIQSDTGEKDDRNQVTSKVLEDYLKESNDITDLNLRFGWLPPWSKLIKRAIVQINRITFDSVRVANDVMFSIKTGYYANKISASNEAIYCVTRTAGSLMTKLDLESFEIRTGIFIESWQFLNEHLSMKAFKKTDLYLGAWGRLHLIFLRKYGMSVFFKYFKLFRENRMLKINPKVLGYLNLRRLRNKKYTEEMIKDRYEE